jgi:hypothetical protein
MLVSVLVLVLAHRPNYVVALSGMDAPHGWDPYGGGSLYQASATGFRLYLWNSGKVGRSVGRSVGGWKCAAVVGWKY